MQCNSEDVLIKLTTLKNYLVNKKHLVQLLLIYSLITHSPFNACFGQSMMCQYIDNNGKIVQTTSKESIPAIYKSKAVCLDMSKEEQLAAPNQINLKGSIREEQMTSNLGTIKLRWPRSAETLFGRTPQRAMADAAQTVSRALSQSGFSPELRRLNLAWNVVFMDSSVPEQQIPSYLVHNCHPGWMTPPANIYIVSERITSGCSGSRNMASSVGDAELARVLVHEMGHAIEHYILAANGANAASMPLDRARAEGFATWFEQYAADFSAIIPKGQTKARIISLAKSAIKQNPNTFNFSGTAEDYSRASLYFMTVVDKRGVYGLMEVYKNMTSSNLSLTDSIKKYFNWTDSQLQNELERIASVR